jgi:hypothetical protein
MSEPSVLSSFLLDRGSGIVIDAKFITSAVVGALGTAVTVQHNLSEIRAAHSTSARNLENKKVAELLDLLAKVPPGDSFSPCRRELELQISLSLRELDALRAKESSLAERPNHSLTLTQRLFVLFPPNDPSAWIIHALAYLFIVGGPLLVLMLVLFRIRTDIVSDVVVSVVFGGIAFRAWALAERKWAMESLKRADGLDQRMQTESGLFQILFVLRKSRSWRMLVAQICMWTCLFCAVESLEDIFFRALDANAGKQGEQNRQTTPANSSTQKSKPPEDPAREAKKALLLLLTSLLSAGICRAWAAAEWHGSSSPHPAFARALFPALKLGTPKVWLLVASFVAAIEALIVSVRTWLWLFQDPLDRVEFAFVSLAACIACNRLLSFLGYAADNAQENKSAALVRSAAA